MNDPQNANANANNNPRFAAFLAKRRGNASVLLKKNDTSGMVLVGMLDAVRRMPGKRSPGSVYVTMIMDQCKVYDETAFKLDIAGNTIVITPDEHNPEERRLKNFENVLVGGFEFDENIEKSVGCIVKCFGFNRNKSGYCVAKMIKVMGHTDKITAALKLPIELPCFDAKLAEQKYKCTILQFRARDVTHNDWNVSVGNVCQISAENQSFKTEEDMIVFKGSVEAMSFHEDEVNMFLIELYWPAILCKQFGITDANNWEALAPKLLGTMRGFIKANIDIQKSSGLAINDGDSASSDYTAGYSVFSNHLELDLAFMVKTVGESITKEEVFEYYEEEYNLEYENAAENPLNHGMSLVKNLSEYTGSLKKVLDSEGAQFYKLSVGEISNVFVILANQLSKKRKK